MRTRVRHEVLPLLAQLNPNIVSHLCDLAEMLDTHRDPNRAPLGKAQRLALEQSLRVRAPLNLWLEGDIELRLRFCQKQAVRKPKA